MFAWPLNCMNDDPGPDARALRSSLGAFPTGVCLVTTVGPDGKREGMTINSFSSVSLTPPLVLWSVREAARSADVFVTASHFTLSVLAVDQQELALHFARPAVDKFAGWEAHFEAGLGGCPRLSRALATFECRSYSCHSEGDHFILVGRVERLMHQDLPPLVFHRGRMGSMAEMAAALSPAAALA